MNATVSSWVLPSRTMRRRAWPPLLGLGYVALVAAMGGLRIDHVLIGALGLLDLYNEKARAFLRIFFPFILTGVIFDSMRWFYWQGIAGRVHVAQPYELEHRVFAISGQTPNEWFAVHHSAVLDLLCGFAYVVYVGEYVCVALLLFFIGREESARTLGVAFLLVNLAGFATYFIYPAAPPWYVAQYGLGPARLDIQPHAAAASRFDALLGTHIFDEMYGRGVDVYGAYPSLHVAYPLMAIWAVWREPRLRRARIPAVLFFLLMCLSAVYLQHHYVTDVALGVLYAGVTIAAVSHSSASRASRTQPAASGSGSLEASRNAS